MKIIGKRSCSNFLLLLFFGCTSAHRCSFRRNHQPNCSQAIFPRTHPEPRHCKFLWYSCSISFQTGKNCKMICCHRYVPFVVLTDPSFFSHFYFIFLYLTLPSSVLNLDRSNTSFYLRQRCTKPDSVPLTRVTTFFFSLDIKCRMLNSLATDDKFAPKSTLKT